MRLYYTVISKEGDPQQKPTLSLGGFCSSSPVPNESFDNLFSEITEYTIQNNVPQYIGLILKNTFDQEADQVKLWMEQDPNDYGKFRVGVVKLTSNGQMENIVSPSSKPVYSEFYDVTGEEEAISIPNMKPGEMYGIWVERTLNADSEYLQKRTQCDFLYEHLNDKLSTEEVVKMCIDFELI